MSSHNMVVQDPVCREIVIPEKFIPVVRFLRPKLQDRKQLGLLSRSPEYCGAQHTRFDHSLGVFRNASLLLKICKEKFSLYFEISQDEEEAFLLSALGHDGGHGPFSHSFEKVVKDFSHEEETYKMFSEGPFYELIVSIFGTKVVQMALDILKGSTAIKRDKEEKKNTELNFLFVVSELLAGCYDIDRHDYLKRDLLNLTGEHKSFSAIMHGMDLDYVNQEPRIVFDYSVLSIIEEYLICRFNMYNKHYFHRTALMLDAVFERFFKTIYTDISPKCSETELVCKFAQVYDDFVIDRYARILNGDGNDESIIYRSFDSIDEQRFFEETLRRVVPIDERFYISGARKVTIYDKKKNRIFIKKDGKVYDITEISHVIRDNIVQNTIVSALDLHLLSTILLEKGMQVDQAQKVLEQARKVFSNQNIEIEKKYLLPQIDDVKEALNVLTIQYKGVSENGDLYYTDPDGILRANRINARIRYEKGKREFTLKKPFEDSSSTTKRDEYNSGDTELPSMISLTNQFLELHSISNISMLIEYIGITTTREKYNIFMNGSLIELVLDKSMYEYKGLQAFSCMVEAELKSGNAISLYLLDMLLKQNIAGIRDCSKSKLEIGEELFCIN